MRVILDVELQSERFASVSLFLLGPVQKTKLCLKGQYLTEKALENGLAKAKKLLNKVKHPDEAQAIRFFPTRKAFAKIKTTHRIAALWLSACIKSICSDFTNPAPSLSLIGQDLLCPHTRAKLSQVSSLILVCPIALSMRTQRKFLLGILGLQFCLLFVYLVYNSPKFQFHRQFFLSYSLPELPSIENSLHQIGTYPNLAIFSVFLDRRLSDNQTESRSLDGHLNGVLRIILVKKRRHRSHLRCLFNDGTSVPSRDLHGKSFSFYELTENHQRLYGGYSVHCDVPPLADLTKGVRICADGSDSGVVFMPVLHANISKIKMLPSKLPSNTQFKHKFTVCVPALHHITKLNTIFLADWLKVNIRLGVTKFRMYYSEMIPNSVKRIFTSVGNQAEVELYPLYWKENNIAVIYESWYYLQTMTVNDCLLRSLYDTEYAFFGDLDEVLVPHSANISNWSTLVGQIWTDKKIPGICFPALRFKESLFGMAKSLTRSSKIDSIRTKCLVRPNAIFEMGIHHISKPYEENAVLKPSKTVNTAFIHHYHRFASKNRDKEVMEEEKDASILRFLDN
nr:protein of unknown function DUF23 [Hymenolepis microstoma]